MSSQAFCFLIILENAGPQTHIIKGLFLSIVKEKI